MASKTKHKKTDFNTWKKSVIDRVINKIKIFKTKFNPQKTNPALKDPIVLKYLEELQRKFVIVPVDKASNNFAFICKTFYVQRILSEISDNPTYNKVDNHTKEEIIKLNSEMCKTFDLNITVKQNSLPSMYWIPKMHKNPIGARFIVASKNCSTKTLSKVVSKVFKMLFSHVERFHKKSRFYSSFNKFWVVQNSFPVVCLLYTSPSPRD